MTRKWFTLKLAIELRVAGTDNSSKFQCKSIPGQLLQYLFCLILLCNYCLVHFLHWALHVRPGGILIRIFKTLVSVIFFCCCCCCCCLFVFVFFNIVLKIFYVIKVICKPGPIACFNVWDFAVEKAHICLLMPGEF